MERIVMVALSDDEKKMMLDASWACFTREANMKVGACLVQLLTEGFVMPTGDYGLVNMIEKMTGVGEVTDTEAMEVVMWFISDVLDGRMPNMSPDWHTN
jgi:hypothetical protein